MNVTIVSNQGRGLTQDTVTFGKYKGHCLQDVLRDRDYCKWLIGQPWLQEQYEFIYNSIKEYDPTKYFFLPCPDVGDFLNTYQYFHLQQDMTCLPLTDPEKTCYGYYLEMIDGFKTQILTKRDNGALNSYDIKAPTGWLKKFEETHAIPRTDFKEFIDAYDLPNLPYILERIALEGGKVYRGAQSFKIAKQRSLDQEAYWETILKEVYGEDVGFQFKYNTCIFDAIHIKSNILFEMKINIKDLNRKQYVRYTNALEKYQIIYLVSKDCIIDMQGRTIYTTDRDEYHVYKNDVACKKTQTEFDLLLLDFEIKEVDDLKSLFGTAI
jgi:hypothetical protein